jgi:hypothetical protein
MYCFNPRAREGATTLTIISNTAKEKKNYMLAGTGLLLVVAAAFAIGHDKSAAGICGAITALTGGYIFKAGLRF